MYCSETVKRTGKICGRKAVNGKCGYHRAAPPSQFKAQNSFEMGPAATMCPWNCLPMARIDQVLPFAARAKPRPFNLAEFRFIL